jgi:ribosome-binding protein aMBF1 (putative translation factor)
MAITATKCPVCNEEITDRGQDVQVQGRTVKVCCDDCASELRDNPSQFLEEAQA